jgi:hypothetical protein
MEQVMKKTKTATLTLEIEYNPRKTDPDGLACAMDRLLETALSTPGILDEYGNPVIREFSIAKETTAPPAPKVVLNISGGVLQDVFGSDSAITVVRVDWDTEGCSPSDDGIVEIPDEHSGTQFADVAEYPVLPLEELIGTETETAIRAAGLELTQPAGRTVTTRESRARSPRVSQKQRAPDTEIRLPCYGITVTLARRNGADKPGSGSIASDLHAAGRSATDRQYNSAIDGLESLILAHACAGVDVESPAYVEGVETAVEAITNHAY